MARELIGINRFLEVYVSTTLEVCEQRDVKGLYRQARQGKIPNMTGITSPYEIPENPNHTINGEDDAKKVVDELAKLITKW